ncbi:J domain-containing protein [Ectobacillus funiculus]|uniref:J domain-containing protein n=1 Tax=Ectobacillus funiculus TaxID=137993 RepID=UPI00101DD7EA|nr:J domain-containing protein [Ectobacillus funiculus]
MEQPFFKKIFTCIYFWKYLNEEESYERDHRIFNAYSRLAESNLIFGVLLFFILLIIGNLFIQDGAELYSFMQGSFSTSIIVAMLHYFLQYTLGRPIYRRIRREKWEIAKEELKEHFKKMIESFREIFNEDESETKAFSDESAEEHRDYFKERLSNSNDGENKITLILKKFELPLDTTDIKVVKRRYLKLAQKYHPDMPNGNAELFKQLVMDFETLKYHFEE